MRVIEPYQIGKKIERRHVSPKRVFAIITICLLLIILAVGNLAYFIPLSAVVPATYTLSVRGENVAINWPKAEQTAVGALGYGLLASNNDKTAVPMASTAKLMTAISVQKQKPLSLKEKGPTITATARDAEIYNYYVSRSGAVIPIEPGDKISQYDLLAAMLVPSANNAADMLAIWAFGSVKNYTVYANNLAKSIGLKSTTIADASGLAPESKTTASDLILIAQAALAEPVVKELVALPSYQIAGIGKVSNTNRLLNQHRIVGIKTGNTNEANGCFVFASVQKIHGQEITILGAVLGSPTVTRAMSYSESLINDINAGFKKRQITKAGRIVGNYQTDWGTNVDVVAGDVLSIFGWAGSNVTADIKLNSLPVSAKAGQTAGSINVGSVSVAAKLDSDIQEPNWRYRFMRWF